MTLVKSFNLIWETKTTDGFFVSLLPVFTAHDSLPPGQEVVSASLSNISKLLHKLTINSQISLKSSSPLTDPLGDPPLFSLESGPPVFPWLISRFLDKRSLF